jgi:hypothetical protein
MDSNKLRRHLTSFITEEMFENLVLVPRAVLGYWPSFSLTFGVSSTSALR